MPLKPTLNLYPSHFTERGLTKAIVEGQANAIGQLALTDPKNLRATEGCPPVDFINPNNLYDWWVVLMKLCDENPYLNVATDILVWETFRDHFNALECGTYFDLFMLVDLNNAYDISFKTLRMVPTTLIRMLNPEPRLLLNPFNLPPMVIYRTRYPNFLPIILKPDGTTVKHHTGYKLPQEAHEARVIEQEKLFFEELNKHATNMDVEVIVDYARDFFTKLKCQKFPFNPAEFQKALTAEKVYPVVPKDGIDTAFVVENRKKTLFNRLIALGQDYYGGSQRIQTHLATSLVSHNIKKKLMIPDDIRGFYNENKAAMELTLSTLAEKYKEAKAARLNADLSEGETVVELELALQEMLFEENTEAYAEAHAKLQNGRSLKPSGELELTLNDLLPKTPFENRRENWQPKPIVNHRKLRRPE